MVSGEIGGLRLNSKGTLSGKVSQESGTCRFTVKVTDRYQNTASKNFELAIDEIQELHPIPTLKLVTNTIPEAHVNNEFQFYFAAEGGISPYEWEIQGELLGLDKDRNGRIWGVPQRAGDSSINATVKSADGQEANRNRVLFKVLPPVPEIHPLEILTEEKLPAAEAQLMYNYALAVTGGIPPYEWKIKNFGSMKNESFLDARGILNLKFNTFGEYEFTAMVVDGSNQEETKKFTVDVRPTTLPLSIVTNRLPTSVRRYQYEYNLNAIGGYPPYQWDVGEKTPLPDGLLLHQGTISGIPTAAWRGILNISVQDALGQQVIRNLPLEILESGEGTIVPKLELLTNTIPLFLAGEGKDFRFATQGGGYPLQWQLEGKIPGDLVFQNGGLRGTPRGNEVSEIQVSVKDPIGQTVEKTFTLQVRRMVDSLWHTATIIAAIISILSLLTLIIIYIRLRRNKKTPLVIQSISIPNARCSFPYKVYLGAAGGVFPYKWSIVEGMLPPGVTLSEDGVLEGVPLKGVKVKEVKDYPFTVRVTDSIGNSTTQEL